MQIVLCGVPQSLVIGPLLYAELSEVIMRHSLDVHQYADQLYLSVLSDDASVAVERLDACLVDVQVWLRASRLRLSLTKTRHVARVRTAVGQGGY